MAASPDSGRPSSKEAWKDAPPDVEDGLYDNNPDSARSLRPFVDEENLPEAMEDEQLPQAYHAKKVQQQKQGGTWSMFSGGVRSIWQTKETEDLTKNKESYIKTTLRELIIYFVFLGVVCIAVFGMIDPNMYYFTKALSRGFLLNAEQPFLKISNHDDFWRYLEGPLLKRGLYWDKWYGQKDVTEMQKGFVLYENKLLGVPRLRMLRVKSDSCKVPGPFEGTIDKCYGIFNGGNEDRSSFGSPGASNSMITGFDYADVESDGFSGHISRYSKGGFAQNLHPTEMNESVAIISHLKKHRWVDRSTRVVFVDFTLYNANNNLFCVVKLIFEFSPTGGVLPMQDFRTVKLIRYVSAVDYFVLVCEGLFCAFVVYYAIEEMLEIKRLRCSYFKDFWNVLDVIVILLAASCIGFSIYRTIVVEEKLDKLLSTDAYANFEYLSFAQTRFNDAVAVLVFFVFVKVFKYISFNKTMTQISQTMSRSSKDLVGFSVMFFIVFFAYAFMGYLIFGQIVKNYSTLYDAVFTLLRTILGDFVYREMEDASPILGPVFFVTYIFFVFFVLLNMFLAIINDAYSEVKEELVKAKNDFNLTDFMRMNLQAMKRKMNVKRDKLIDVQLALKEADADRNGFVDFDEWRNCMKRRGYADQEAEQLFMKYDTHANRQLDRNEQVFMLEDLSHKQSAVDETMIDLQMAEEAELNAKADERRRDKGPMTIKELKYMERRCEMLSESIESLVYKLEVAAEKVEDIDGLKVDHRDRITVLLEDIANSEDSPEEKWDLFMKGLQKEMSRISQS